MEHLVKMCCLPAFAGGRLPPSLCSPFASRSKARGRSSKTSVGVTGGGQVQAMESAAYSS